MNNVFTNIIKQSIRDIKSILEKRSFSFVQSETIDLKKNCFDNLLMNNHSCISEKETFFINKDYILRPHTTNFQSQIFKMQYNEIVQTLRNNIPLRIYTCGSVFRKDSSSMHSYVFHQFDILMFENKDFRYFISIILNIIFSFLSYRPKYLIRESYFPFTYPSWEIDIMYNNQWVEILGCGLTHKKILYQYNLQTAIGSVFALGLGLERLVMIKNNISNINYLRNNITDEKDIFSN